MKANVIFFLLVIITLVGCEEKNNSIKNKTNLTTAVPVEVMKIKQDIIQQKIELSGILQPVNTVNIIAEVSGNIISKYKYLGDYVAPKQTMAIVDDVIIKSKYDQAKAQLITARSNLNIAKQTFLSDSILYNNNDISEFEFAKSKANYNSAKAQYLSATAALNANKKSFNDTRIKSPLKGVVSRDNIDLGTMVVAGNILYRVVDISKLKLEVYIPQEYINLVKVGDSAKIYVSSLNEKFSGIIKRLSPQADKNTGGFLVEIEVPNKKEKIKAGMTAKTEILISKANNLLAVPEYTVTTKQGKNYIYKIKNGYAQLTEVNVSENFGDKVIIKSGIEINDTIVTVGIKNLGTKTKVLIENNLK